MRSTALTSVLYPGPVIRVVLSAPDLFSCLLMKSAARCGR